MIRIRKVPILNWKTSFEKRCRCYIQSTNFLIEIILFPSFHPYTSHLLGWLSPILNKSIGYTLQEYSKILSLLQEFRQNLKILSSGHVQTNTKRIVWVQDVYIDTWNNIVKCLIKHQYFKDFWIRGKAGATSTIASMWMLQFWHISPRKLILKVGEKFKIGTKYPQRMFLTIKSFIPIFSMFSMENLLIYFLNSNLTGLI